MTSTSTANTTVPQSRKLETVSFQVDPDFKCAIDMEVKRRRSTIRKELSLAISEHLGITCPFDVEPEKPAA